MTAGDSETVGTAPTDTQDRDAVTRWFEDLYAAAEKEGARVPWDRSAPHQHLVTWATQSRLQGQGKRAIVIGSGFGDDAEYIASLGFETIGFDVAPSAVRQARLRYPDSKVTYVVADLFDPPAEWNHGFDLVFENQTVQSLPGEYRRQAIDGITELVGPGGTLAVFSARAVDGVQPPGPPWPLDRSEIVAFADNDLQPIEIAPVSHSGSLRWRAMFYRAKL